jgi:hypothetical protein
LECKTQAWKGQHSFVISAHWDKHVIPCRSGVVISMSNGLPVTDYRVAGVRRRPNVQNGSKLIPFLYQSGWLARMVKAWIPAAQSSGWIIRRRAPIRAEDVTIYLSQPDISARATWDFLVVDLSGAEISRL